MRTRMGILVAAAGLSLAGAAHAAPADPQPSYSDGYGYDIDHVYNDGYGYTDGNGDADGSSSGFNCSDNGAYDANGTANCGWYNGLFYPGFGNFVFDRDHHRHELTSRQHDYITRQGRGPDGGRRVGLDSSGGVVPPTVSQPQAVPQNGGAGARAGFGGGMFRGMSGSSGGVRNR